MTKQTCAACGVVIENDIVYFSFGEPGTRSRLKARVCQYAKEKSKCINQQDVTFKPEDFYSPPKDLTSPEELLRKFKEDA